VQERNLGEFEHAAIQAFLTGWFFQHRHQWQLHVLPEMRIRVSSERSASPICAWLFAIGQWNAFFPGLRWR
jgi:hypothetical protein